MTYLDYPRYFYVLSNKSFTYKNRKYSQIIGIDMCECKVYLLVDTNGLQETPNGGLRYDESHEQLKSNTIIEAMFKKVETDKSNCIRLASGFKIYTTSASISKLTRIYDEFDGDRFFLKHSELLDYIENVNTKKVYGYVKIPHSEVVNGFVKAGDVFIKVKQFVGHVFEGFIVFEAKAKNKKTGISTWEISSVKEFYHKHECTLDEKVNIIKKDLNKKTNKYSNSNIKKQSDFYVEESEKGYFLIPESWSLIYKDVRSDYGSKIMKIKTIYDIEYDGSLLMSIINDIIEKGNKAKVQINDEKKSCYIITENNKEYFFDKRQCYIKEKNGEWQKFSCIMNAKSEPFRLYEKDRSIEQKMMDRIDAVFFESVIDFYDPFEKIGIEKTEEDIDFFDFFGASKEDIDLLDDGLPF